MTIRIYRDNGDTQIEYYAKKVNTVFAMDDLVYLDSNGYLAPAVDGVLFVALGLVKKAVAATDSDYASTTRIPVLICGDDVEFICDVGTGTAAQTDVGEQIDIDDEKLVDVTASSYDVFFVTGIISATQVIAKLNKKSGAAA